MTEEEAGVTCQQVKDHRTAGPARKLQEAREGPHSHLDVGLLASRTVQINFCSSKPSSLWYFIKAAPGNKYKDK